MTTVILRAAARRTAAAAAAAELAVRPALRNGCASSTLALAGSRVPMHASNVVRPLGTSTAAGNLAGTRPSSSMSQSKAEEPIEIQEAEIVSERLSDRSPPSSDAQDRSSSSGAHEPADGAGIGSDASRVSSSDAPQGAREAAAVPGESRDDYATRSNTVDACSGHSHDHDHAEMDNSHGTNANDDDDDDWFGTDASSESPQKAYQRIIDTARLAVEHAYERNGALVGALGEAGGDEGASERWLRGFLRLVRKQLPTWWGESRESKERHEEALMELAMDRDGDYFIKRCVDVKKLKKTMDKDDFALIDFVAFDAIMSVTMDDIDADDADDVLGGQHDDHDGAFFDESAIAEAKEIWGEDTMKDLTRKTREEREAELEAREMEKAGGMVKVEEGDWWGTAATGEEPEDAYRRLIDAARRGVMLAHEKKGEFVGAIADAVEGSGILGKFKEDDQEDEDEGKEGERIEKAEGGERGGEEHGWKGEGEEGSTDDDAQDGPNEELLGPNDAQYHPKELGPNASEHFSAFLQTIEEEKLMPPWWNDEHDAALWRMGRDVEGTHFLGHPLDREDLEKMYDAGVRQKVSMLAEAAAGIGTGAADDDDDDGGGGLGKFGGGVDGPLDDMEGFMGGMKGDASDVEDWDDVEEHWDDMEADTSDTEDHGDMEGDVGDTEEGTSEIGKNWDEIASLKDELRSRGLKVGGRKAELVRRLKDDGSS